MTAMHEISIEELVLSVPGVEPTDVKGIVDEVLMRVQDQLRGTTRTGEVRLAELKVTTPSGSRADLIDAISDALVEALEGSS